MMTALTIIGVGVLAVFLLLIALILTASAMVGWAAHGESDVNGDPERDSGMSDDQIAALHRHWDRGSLKASTDQVQPKTRKESHA